jgi:hypothetical protein
MPWSWAEQRHFGEGTTDRSPGRYRSENEDNANNRISRMARMARMNRREADRLSLRVVGFPNETRSMTSPVLYMQEGFYTLVS